jgi:hypothetical protein
MIKMEHYPAKRSAYAQFLHAAQFRDAVDAILKQEIENHEEY